MQRHGLGRDQLDLGAAQEAGELVFRERVGHRRHGGQDRAGIGADHRAGGQGLALARGLPAAVVLGAAAVGQPAHDGRFGPSHLHAVDAEVVVVLAGRLGRALGDDQRPGDQRRGLARPAGLDRQLGEIDLVARQHHLLHRRRASPSSAAWTSPCASGSMSSASLQPRGGSGWRRKASSLADLAQVGGSCALALQVTPMATRFDRAEQVDQARAWARARRRPDDFSNSTAGPPLGQQARLDLGHLEARWRRAAVTRTRRPPSRAGP